MNKQHRTGRVSLPIAKLTATLVLAITLTLTACEEKEAAKKAEAANAYAEMQLKKAKAEEEALAKVQAEAEAAAKAIAEAAVKAQAEADRAAYEAQEARKAYIKANGGKFTDARDKKTYKTIKIGTQVRMAENLNYAVKDYSMCYDKKPANCKEYGRFYFWDAAKEACPSGWHLPSDKEWQTLVEFAGGYEIAGNKLKTTIGWGWENDNLSNANGTDEFGFSALPGGYAIEECGSGEFRFRNIGSGSGWWSATITRDGGRTEPENESDAMTVPDGAYTLYITSTANAEGTTASTGATGEADGDLNYVRCIQN